MTLLQKSFYQKKTLVVAQGLLGCFLVRAIGRKVVRARIVETESYIGEDDLACHASRGRTKRTETMYGEAGHVYVYMVYGMYHCLNIVTERKGFPAAVLIRAVTIDDIPHKETNGPGKLCRLLQIDRTLNGLDITKGKKLWIDCPSSKLRIGKTEKIVASKRIGIEYAKHCREYLWRFTIEEKR